MSESIQVTVEEIRLQNFRAFENARLQLSDLTFLVGRNGAGKSSLLDAVDLLRQSTSESLENALDGRGGLT
jgi:predicted ATPase